MELMTGVKLKEKLAWQYLDPHFIHESGEYDLNEHEIFLAGFSKYREMALMEYRKTSRTPFLDRLETLGEEEV
jgi:hypothetical protein